MTVSRQVEQARRRGAEYQAALNALYAHQEGRCAICRAGKSVVVVLDHCHDSGLIRGWLCVGCNSQEPRPANRDAPRFVAYRDNPPAAQLGIVLVKRPNITSPRPNLGRIPRPITTTMGPVVSPTN